MIGAVATAIHAGSARGRSVPATRGEAQPMALALDLRERVCIVTGGSRGIGAAAVRTLHEAGASVLFTYRSTAEPARRIAAELGENVVALAADLFDVDAPAKIMDATLARFGRVDVLVNNAAIFAENSFDGNDIAAWREGWRRTFTVNLFAAADLAFLAIAHMRRRGGGTIINVASRAAHRGELTFADYGASKAALVNFTKSIARSCAAYGIAAFAVAPGFIETGMAASELAARGDEIRAEIPSGRVGSPEDVAGIIAFLASPLANYATGATIDVNGASYVR
jgi:3-oxoacyl-[acyl-carrier protein] reductase